MVDRLLFPQGDAQTWAEDAGDEIVDVKLLVAMEPLLKAGILDGLFPDGAPPPIDIGMISKLAAIIDCDDPWVHIFRDKLSGEDRAELAGAAIVAPHPDEWM